MAGKMKEPPAQLRSSSEAAAPTERLQAIMKRRFGEIPSSTIPVSLCGDENNYKHGPSAIKRPRSAQERAKNEVGQQTGINEEIRSEEHVVEDEDERGRIRSLQEIMGKQCVNKVAKVKHPLPRPSKEAAAAARSERRMKLLQKQPSSLQSSQEATNSAKPEDASFLLGVGIQRQQANLKPGPTSAIPCSAIDIATRGEENSHGHASSAMKRSPERHHSPNACSLLNGNEVLQNSMSQTVINQEMTSEVLLDSSQHNTNHCIKLSGRKQSRELYSPHSLLDVDSSFQHREIENPDLDSPFQDTHRQKSVGYESVHDLEGICIRGNLLGEELTNDSCEENRNECVSTNHAAIDSSCYKMPFPKTLDAWPEVEASDVFKLLPQKPHFSPLQKYSTETREGMALGLMMAFVALVKNVRQASREKSMEFFQYTINRLHEFEDHGFDVQFLKSKFTKMLKNICDHLKLIHQKKEAINELMQQLAHLDQEVHQIEKEMEDENMELLGVESEITKFQEEGNEAVRQFHSDLDDLHYKELS